MNPKFNKSLRELRLVMKYYDKNIFSFSTIKHLNLEALDLHGFAVNLDDVDDDDEYINRDRHISSDDLEAFLTSQTKLKILKIFLNRGAFLSQIIRILCSVNSIQELTLHFYCEYDQKMYKENYEMFWKLKLLSLMYANGALFESLTQESNMESLTIQAFDDNSMKITNYFQYLKNLKFLNISLVCNQAYEEEDLNIFCITNDFIQAIFKHLINLQELYLRDDEEECVSFFYIVSDYNLNKLFLFFFTVPN